jgi:hypothetical protein
MSKSKHPSSGKTKKEEPVIEVIAVIEPEFIDRNGIFMFPDNSKYEGDYQENVSDGTKMRHGNGTITWNYGPVEKYDGQWFQDKMNGSGSYSFASGAQYDGIMKNNLFEGEGKYVFPDGAKYVGQWQQNKMHGNGEYTDASGIVWSGIFFNGLYDSGKTHISLRPSEGI